MGEFTLEMLKKIDLVIQNASIICNKFLEFVPQSMDCFFLGHNGHFQQTLTQYQMDKDPQAWLGYNQCLSQPLKLDTLLKPTYCCYWKDTGNMVSLNIAAP